MPKDIAGAILLQRELSKELVLQGRLGDADLIAGADCSAYGNTGTMVGAIVIWQRSTDKIVEVATAALEVDFPHIPGLLAFRELPALLAAWRKLRRAPDAVICDGQGIAHMRGLGIASHFGLYIDVPTIGCGKSRLVGSYVQPGTQKGSVEMLTYKGVEVGVVVRTRANISPGNQCDIEGAVALTLRTTGKYRLPEPIRAAHKSCGEMLSELTLSKRDIL